MNTRTLIPSFILLISIFSSLGLAQAQEDFSKEAQVLGQGLKEENFALLNKLIPNAAIWREAWTESEESLPFTPKDFPAVEIDMLKSMKKDFQELLHLAKTQAFNLQGAEVKAWEVLREKVWAKLRIQRLQISLASKDQVYSFELSFLLLNSGQYLIKIDTCQAKLSPQDQEG